jgi:ribosome biogenesis GTPase A
MTELSPAAPAERLAELVRLARKAGAGAVATEAEELAGRLAEGRFFVACVGLFKRGKSTLINALVGRQALADLAGLLQRAVR